MTDALLVITFSAIFLSQLILAAAVIWRTVRAPRSLAGSAVALCGECRGGLPTPPTPLPPECPECSTPLHVAGILSPALAVKQQGQGGGAALGVLGWTILWLLPIWLIGFAITEELEGGERLALAILSGGVAWWVAGIFLLIHRSRVLLCKTDPKRMPRRSTSVALLIAAALSAALGVVLAAALIRDYQTGGHTGLEGPVHESVVVLELNLADGRRKNAVGFLLEPGYLVTNRHCIEGAVGGRVRIPGHGRASISGIAADGETLDVVFLELDNPFEDVPRLMLADDDAGIGEAVWVVRRQLRWRWPIRSEGRILEVASNPDGHPAIFTSATGPPGTSGSPIVNRAGQLVGIVSRGSDAGLSGPLRSAILELSAADPVPLDQWWAAQDRPGFFEGSRLRRTANRLWGEGDLDAAEEHAREALRHDPMLFDMYDLLWHRRFRERDFDEAAEIAMQWTHHFPRSSIAWMRLGEAEYYWRKRWDQTEAAFRMSLSLDPSGARAWQMLGWALEMQERPEEAVEPYERGLSLDPGNARVWWNLAGIHHRAERLEEAMHAYERAIEQDTEGLASLRYWLAMLHLRFEDDVAVIQRLRECIEVDSQEHRCHCALGQVLARGEALEEALSAYTFALELQHDCDRSLAGLVAVLHELGRTDDAAQRLQQLAALAPDTAQRVEDALARGEWREALDQACAGDTR